ncbi:MAG: energy transducer TonB [Sphingobacterium sp.]|jgi:TonB family protein|nr:energy transducer TonB [Sphingobacterium sp.]
MKYSKIIILFLAVFMYCMRSYGQDIVVETLPTGKNSDTIAAQYPGGETLFVKYMAQHIRYPLGPQLRGKQEGVVKVSFIVDTMGAITRPRIEKSIDSEYDKDILRVLRESPRWIPGSIKGKKVKFAFDLPVRFHDRTNALSKSAKEVKKANVLLYGTLLNARNRTDAVRYVYTAFFEVDAKFSKALLGPKYNRPLFIVNDFNIEPKKYNKKGFERLLKLLSHCDSSKFKFQLDDKSMPYDQWRKYLKSDSIAMFSIYTDPQYQERQEGVLGTVWLLTEIGLKHKKKEAIKSAADCATFNNLLAQYRSGKTSLPRELIYINNNYYQKKAILDSLDMSVITGIKITRAEEIQGRFQDSRNNGYIELFTKSYRAGQNKIFRDRLKELLLRYRNSGFDHDEYVIFLNDQQRLNLPMLSALDPSTISRIHIISKEEARAFFGNSERRPIIYLFVYNSPEERNKAERVN